MQRHGGAHQRALACQRSVPIWYNTNLCEWKLRRLMLFIKLNYIIYYCFFHLLLWLRTPPWPCGSPVPCCRQRRLACRCGASWLDSLSEGLRRVGRATSKSRWVFLQGGPMRSRLYLWSATVCISRWLTKSNWFWFGFIQTQNLFMCWIICVKSVRNYPHTYFSASLAFRRQKMKLCITTEVWSKFQFI